MPNSVESCWNAAEATRSQEPDAIIADWLAIAGKQRVCLGRAVG